jgi:SAM-dependent methyltransferase
MTTTAPDLAAADTTAEAFAERLFGAVLGTQEVFAAYLGDRLGWYRALAAAPQGLTSGELASSTATAERYAREWLEHQTLAAVTAVDDAALPATDRRYRLPAGHAEVLTDELSLNHLMPIARMVGVLGRQVDSLVDAYRTGGGVSWAQLGDEAREAQGAANRPLFLRVLGQEYLPQVPDIHDALSRGGRVADVGCGVGWSSIGIALAYPGVTVDGFDVDEPSIERARRHAVESGVADRVRFHVADGGSMVGADYDLVAAFECIHDMADPVPALAAMRRLAGDAGAVVVMDERVGEAFTGDPTDEVERFMYGFSLMCCLPDGLSHGPSKGTGTVMRPSTFEGYAKEAGFSAVEVLPIEDDFFRFYRLV